MNYDSWKLATPPEYENEPDPEEQPPMRIPTNDQLTKAAEKTYGTQCSQNFCKAGVGYRLLEYTDDTLKPERSPDGDGTWITVRVFVADDAIDPVL